MPNPTTPRRRTDPRVGVALFFGLTIGSMAGWIFGALDLAVVAALMSVFGIAMTMYFTGLAAGSYRKEE